MDCKTCNGKPEEVKEECAFCGKREEVLLAELREGNDNTETQDV